MKIKSRVNKLERAINDTDPTGRYTCKGCGRDQAYVITVTAQGEKPDWPRCEHCPAPRGGMHVVIEDGPVPVLPPAP